jgi:hypothetical protein
MPARAKKPMHTDRLCTSSQVIFEPYDDDFSNDGVLEIQVLVQFHPDVLHPGSHSALPPTAFSAQCLLTVRHRMHCRCCTR